MSHPAMSVKQEPADDGKARKACPSLAVLDHGGVGVEVWVRLTGCLVLSRGATLDQCKLISDRENGGGLSPRPPRHSVLPSDKRARERCPHPSIQSTPDLPTAVRITVLSQRDTTRGRGNAHAATATARGASVLCGGGVVGGRGQLCGRA